MGIELKTYYVVYKITNLINGKIYIGCHQTKNLDDNYMGSGNLIKFAIEKYGSENFNKEYIKIFDNEDEMYEMESEIVNEDFVKDDSTYNLKEGGFGGWSSATDKAAWLSKNDVEYRERKSKHFSSVLKKAHKDGKIRYDTFTGKTHTEETKRIMSEKASVRQQGENNTMYGRRWVCNLKEKENKLLLKGDSIPEGWVCGKNVWDRKIKHSTEELKKLKSDNARIQAERKRVENEPHYKQLQKRIIESFSDSDCKSFSKFSKENHSSFGISYGTMYKIRNMKF